MNELIYIINVVSPVFFLVVVGLFLRTRGFLSESFIDSSSKFVFNVSLPVLVFMKLYNVDLSVKFDLFFNLYMVLGTIALFFLSWAIAIFYIKNRQDRGVFIQGAFRSNYAIIGLAIILGMFGENAVSKASLVLSFVLPFYNLLSVIVLTVYNPNNPRMDYKKVIRDISLNPLILGVVAAIPFALLKIELFPAIKQTGQYLSSIALPLALIGIGGSMNMRALKKASGISVSSSVVKIIVAPIIFTGLGYFIGYRGADLGIIFIVFGCPTAIASFVMAIAMGSSGKIAGNIIIISTLGSVVTYTIGLYLLRYFHLI